MSSAAIDLGRHQAFAALAGDRHPDDARMVRLGSAGDGLVVRWCEAGAPAERLHDRLDRLVDQGNVRGAAETAAAIAECMRDLIGPSDGPRRLRLGVPLTASPGHRAHLRTAFGNAGFVLDDHDLVSRPYAALGYWLATGGHRANGLPRGKTLLLDNDSGRVSALVVDIARCRILADGQISDGRAPDPHASTLLLRRVLETSYGSAGQEPPVPWSVLSASIADVVISGSQAHHPLFHRFIAERFPASTLHGRPEHRGSQHSGSQHSGPEHSAEMVVRGLHHVDRFASYDSAWPTLDVCFDDRVVRPAGPWTIDDAAPTVIPVGTLLGFGGAPIVLTSSSELPHRRRAGDRQPASPDIVLADAALRIPERIGPFPLLTIHPSGAIEIRGTDASLRLHVGWPVASAAPRPVTVVVEDILDLTIDRSSFTPRGDPPHRATGES